MKKNIILIILITLLVGIFIIFYVSKSNNNSSNSNIVFININTLEEKIKNKESFVLVLTQDGCSHCESYAPVIENVAKKYAIKIYDLNLTELNNDEIPRLNAIANISGTPTTIFFKNGEEETTLNRINGNTTEEKLVKKLKNLGYIKGE